MSLSKFFKSIPAFLNNVDISVKNNKIKANYKDDATGTLVSFGKNDKNGTWIYAEVDPTETRTEKSDSLEIANVTTSVDDEYKGYKVIGSMIMNYDNLIGGIFSACVLIDELNENLDNIREAVKHTIFNGQCATSINRSEIGHGECGVEARIVNFRNDLEGLTILYKYISPTRINTLVGSDNLTTEETLEKIRNCLLFDNNSYIPSPTMLDKFPYAVGLAFDDMIKEIKNNCTPLTGRWGEGIKLIESYLIKNMSEERLNIGEHCKMICGLDYTPELPYCSWADHTTFNRFKKKYKYILDNEDLKNEIVKNPIYFGLLK